MPKKTRAHRESKSFAPYAALILATAIWAAALPVIKITLNDIPPFSFLLLRFLVVAVVMLPIMFFELKTTPIHRKDIKNLVLLGIFGQAALAFIFWGLKYTTAIDTALIGTAAPLITIFAGHYFYHEKVNNMVKFGVAIATLGTALIVFEPILGQQTIAGDAVQNHIGLRMFGNVMVILYNVAFSIYIIFSKVIMGQLTKEVRGALKFFHVEPMKKEYSPTLITGVTFYVGLAAIIPFAIAENMGYFGVSGMDFSTLTWVPIAGILYMALLSSIVAYIAYEWGLKGAEATDSAIFGYLGTLFTIPFSLVMLGEIPTKAATFGAFVIAVGVVIAEKYKRR